MIVAFLWAAPSGSASVDAAHARCTISGTEAADELVGTDRKDVICGRGGDDLIRAGAGNDVLRGAAGADELHGDDGRDVLIGGTEVDALDGGTGTNRCDDEGLTTGPNLCVGYYALKQFSIDDPRVDTDRRPKLLTAMVRLVNTDPDPAPTTGLGFSFQDRPAYSVSGGAWQVSGDTTDGIWKGSLFVPKHAPNGRYDLGLELTIGMFDQTQTVSLTPRQLGAAGFSSYFEELGPKANELPRALSFEVEPQVVDTSQSEQTVTVRARLADDRRLRPTSAMVAMGIDDGPFDTSQFQLERGDSRDGIWEARLRLPQGSPPGVFQLRELSLSDLFSNIRLDADDLQAQGVALPGVQQVGAGDDAPPLLQAFDVDPQRIDVTQGGRATVNFRVDATDDGTGQPSWRVYAWRSIDSMWAGLGGVNALTPTGAMQFPFNDEGIGRAPGDYGLYVELRDALGNVNLYRPEELAALGFPSFIHNG